MAFERRADFHYLWWITKVITVFKVSAPSVFSEWNKCTSVTYRHLTGKYLSMRPRRRVLCRGLDKTIFYYIRINVDRIWWAVRYNCPISCLSDQIFRYMLLIFVYVMQEKIYAENRTRDRQTTYIVTTKLHFAIRFISIESLKTTSMEGVRTGVLEKNKEYLRSKDKAEKWYDVSRHI